MHYVVLDEGDEMLDAGFAPAVEQILELTYQPQMVLASATMPFQRLSSCDGLMVDSWS